MLISERTPLSAEWGWNFVSLRAGSWPPLLFSIPQLLCKEPPRLPVAPCLLSLVCESFPLEPTWSLTILPQLSLKTHLMVLYPEQPCMTPHIFFCASMFYLLCWRWGHLTWWGWSCVAEGRECGWLKESGPPPGHGHCRLLNVCLQHEIKLEIWPLGWEHSFFTSTLRALHLSFCQDSLWVWDTACVCKGRTCRCPFSLGQLAIPTSPEDTLFTLLVHPFPAFWSMVSSLGSPALSLEI